MNRQMMRPITALLFISTIQQGYDAQIVRVSSNPVGAFEGSDALFQWTLSTNVTSRPDYQGLVFGLWRNGYLATYITTVTRTNRIISNPGLKDEAPQLDGRVQWKGDLSKSFAAFQISHVSAKDQMDYGLVLNFGPYKNSLSDSVRLEVRAKTSFVTTLPSLPISVSLGKNATFYCQFHVHEKDKAFYEGVTVGVWERGAIILTLMTVTRKGDIIINPKLDKEGPEYSQRVHAHLSTNKSDSDTSILSVVLADVQESHKRSYGCSMYFGPYKEPIGSSVSIDVQDFNSNNSLSMKNKSSQDSLEVRVGKTIMIPCPVLAEVIQVDGTFKASYWSYCVSKSCTTTETKWQWLAGMNSDGATEVTQKGRYANRVNLTGNGTLEVNNVQVADATDYRCTVRRINYTSPRVYFVTLVVNASEPPTIVKRSKDKVTVVEGNILYLFCEAEGFPIPSVTWRKDGKLLQSSINDTNFIIHDARDTDAGNYECKATNSVGTVKYTVEVTIKGDSDDKKLTKTDVILLVFGLCLLAFLIVIGAVGYKWHKRTKKRGLYDEV
ncbi:uncharacterized protein LOC144662814 isoform X1 [Oculina patagonica]